VVPAPRRRRTTHGPSHHARRQGGPARSDGASGRGGRPGSGPIADGDGGAAGRRHRPAHRVLIRDRRRQREHDPLAVLIDRRVGHVLRRQVPAPERLVVRSQPLSALSSGHGPIPRPSVGRRTTRGPAVSRVPSRRLGPERLDGLLESPEFDEDDEAALSDSAGVTEEPDTDAVDALVSVAAPARYRTAWSASRQDAHRPRRASTGPNCALGYGAYHSADLTLPVHGGGGGMRGVTGLVVKHRRDGQGRPRRSGGGQLLRAGRAPPLSAADGSPRRRRATGPTTHRASDHPA